MSNEQTPSGMPPHKLHLKVGAVVMPLRNLDIERGLYNGTRLIVTELKPILILARILTGSACGDSIFIPHIELAPADTDLPFTLRR